MKKQTAKKGSFGYTEAHKKRQLIKTLIFFLIPLALFVIGYVTTGSKKNYFTLLAVVGMLPGCKEMVNVCMFWRRHSLSRELYEEIEEHAAPLLHYYELVLTTYEKNYAIPSLAIHGSEVVGYTEQAESTGALKKVGEHITSVLKTNGIGGVHVHIFTDRRAYLERLDALASREPEDIPFSGDGRYPGMSREEVIGALILALSL